MTEKKAARIEASNIVKDYPLPCGGFTRGLTLEGLSLRGGEMLAVEGPSGSGKTTLLHLLAGFYSPTEGRITFNGSAINAGDKFIDSWRAGNVGYIFQSMNLLPDFSVLENILIAAELSGLKKDEALKKALSLLEYLGVKDKAERRPALLSLGEQQRSAVARALVHSPRLILADEPTASLDTENSGLVIQALKKMCGESGSILVIATHDEAVKRQFDKILSIKRVTPAERGDAA